MERSRQSARECRARKKLRYDYLEDLVLDRERTVEKLQNELKMYEEWCKQLDRGQIPQDLQKQLAHSTNVPISQPIILANMPRPDLPPPGFGQLSDNFAGQNPVNPPQGANSEKSHWTH